MRRAACLIVAFGLAGCGTISAQMDASSRSCSAGGGVLTASGCQGGGASPFFSSSPGRTDTPPPTNRFGEPNYDAQGRYSGANGIGNLVDRPVDEPARLQPPLMPSNVTCTKNAAGNAGSCVSN